MGQQKPARLCKAGCPPCQGELCLRRPYFGSLLGHLRHSGVVGFARASRVAHVQDDQKAVANAIFKWAREQGAVSFAHWFFPIRGGGGAEGAMCGALKMDTMIDLDWSSSEGTKPFLDIASSGWGRRHCARCGGNWRCQVARPQLVSGVALCVCSQCERSRIEC